MTEYDPHLIHTDIHHSYNPQTGETTIANPATGVETRYDALGRIIQPSQEAVNGAQETDHQVRQEGEDVKGDGGVRQGQTEIGLEGRSESDQPEAGDRDRPEGKRPVEEVQDGQQDQVRADARRAAEEAQRRYLLAPTQPIRARVFIKDGRGGYLDILVVIPWVAWLDKLQQWRGIAHDKGFVPLEAIAYVVHLDAVTGAPVDINDPTNIVPFKR